MIFLLPTFTKLTPINIHTSSRTRVYKLVKIPMPGAERLRILTISDKPPSRAPNCIGKKKSRLPINDEKARTKIASQKVRLTPNESRIK